MHRIASIILITLVLVACGGGDDDDDDTSSSGSAPTATVASAAPTSGSSSSAGSTQPAAVPSAPAPTEPTTSEPTPTESAASEPTATAASGGDTESLDGAPTQASSDFPDVQVPLEAGSSGEVASMDPDPFSDTSSLDPESKVKVTINEILDPAEIGGTIFSPEPGNRWYALNMTMEATGSAIANTGVWELVTTDGTEYTNIFVLGDMPEITYGSIEPGATTEGLVVFEIPEDATVQWILMSPTVFVGGNLVFVN
jgi:hypothetical protein